MKGLQEEGDVHTIPPTVIRKVELRDNKLCFELSPGTLTLWDDGQECCEDRYLTCDDDLSYYNGAELYGFKLRQVLEQKEEYQVHEIGFVIVTTSKGEFTLCTHNEHNGYYGGFSLKVDYRLLG